MMIPCLDNSKGPPMHRWTLTFAALVASFVSFPAGAQQITWTAGFVNAIGSLLR